MIEGKEKWYITFGQKSPFRKGWVEIYASNFQNAIEEINYVFGNKYSNTYDESNFKKEHFPDGRLGEIMEAR